MSEIPIRSHILIPNMMQKGPPCVATVIAPLSDGKRSYCLIRADT